MRFDATCEVTELSTNKQHTLSRAAGSINNTISHEPTDQNVLGRHLYVRVWVGVVVGVVVGGHTLARRSFRQKLCFPWNIVY
jgi:hypothetical protein